MKLPPLPVILARVSKADHDSLEQQFRAYGIACARAALEEAKQACREFDRTDSLSNYGLVMARMIEEIKIEGEKE